MIKIDEVGLIKSVVIKEVLNRPSVIKSIARKRSLTIKEVSDILRYNIVTVNQLSLITGCTVNCITQKTRPRYNKEKGFVVTELDYCYPFSCLNGNGFKFVFRNKQCEDLILDSLQNKAK